MTQMSNNYNIIVTGVYGSGKTEFVGTLHEPSATLANEQFVPIPQPYGYGHIVVDDTLFGFYIPPSSRRFDFMWEMLAHGTMIAFAVLVDSSKPETFRDARIIAETFEAYSLVPYVIGANKQDLSDAWSADDVRIALRIPKEIPVIPCSARDKKSVANVLIALCQEILKRMEAES